MALPAEVPYLHIYLAFTLGVSLLHWALDFRQLKALRNKDPPPELASAAFKDPNLYKKTQAYSLDKWWFGLFHSMYSLCENVTVVLLGLIPWTWTAAGQALTHLPPGLAASLHLGPGASPMARELATSVLFMLAFSGFTLLSSLPWSLCSTFVIEARHGFNKQTLALFMKDTMMSIALGLLILPPVVLGITYILLVAGPMMPLYLWLFVLAFSLFFMTVYPTLIQPLFNKFLPLPEGPLRTQIEQLAGSLRFPLKKLYTMDGSKRSAHSNAYMYGWGQHKRIVLFDTLISQCSTDQVVAVLAHELGHWKLRHTPINFAVGQAITLINFGLLAFIRSQPGLYTAFGFHGEQPALVALVLFQLISTPVDEVINFAMHCVSRTFEFQADNFAVQQGHGVPLRTALLVMEEENKGAMHVDPWFSAYHYSHPPLVERLRAIDRAVAGLAKKTT
ncbi:peptidase family M48-domain-containing protein [Haematococcus lacustris]